MTQKVEFPDDLNLDTATYWELQAEVKKLRALRVMLLEHLNPTTHEGEPESAADNTGDCYGL